MNDKQKVFDILNQATQFTAPEINRRSFCTLIGLSFIGFILPGCSASDSNTSLKMLSQEAEFSQFFDVIFPASDLGLNNYREAGLSRIQRLPDKKAEVIMLIYQRFKRRLWVKRNLGTKDYNRTMGEACLIDLMHSKYADQCNLALDIIYYEISKDDELLTALWGRRFSLNDKKCIYWENYDQAVS